MPTIDLHDPALSRRSSERRDGGTVAALAGRRTAPWLERLLGAGDHRALADLYLVAELATVVLLGAGLAVFYVGGSLRMPDYGPFYTAPILVFAGLLFLAMRARDLYETRRLTDFGGSVGDVVGAAVGALAGLVLLGFVFNVANDYSRVWAAGWFAASLLAILALRAGAARWLRALIARGYTFRSVAVYGPRSQGFDTARRLRQAGTGVSIAGVFGPERRDGERLRRGDDGLAELMDFTRAHPLDSILVIADPQASERLDRTVQRLSELPVAVRVALVAESGSTPILGLPDRDGVRSFAVQAAPISRWGHLAKALFDRALALAGLIALLPLFAVVALLIRLDGPGPIFFRQRRHGFNRRVFFVWKFRTMSVQEDGAHVRQAVRGDARVTRVGAFLRRTSIDELPQLLNVLQGDMSLVGPRPHPLSLDGEYERVLHRYAARHKVRPGITGLAQINGLRGPTDPESMRMRLQYDLRYIETWSLWLDVKILLATPFLGIVGRNAF